MLHEAAGKIAMVGELHRWLAEKPAQDEVDLSDNLIRSCAWLVHGVGFESKVALWQRLSGICRVTAEEAQQIGLIVGEIIMNAAKQAHPTGLRTQVSIACRLDSSGRASVEIADDGVGLPKGFDIDRGVGFRLIRALAKPLKAELGIETDSLGLTFRLRLPPRAARMAVAAR
jgi:two-component sensor histidine kinase